MSENGKPMIDRRTAIGSMALGTAALAAALTAQTDAEAKTYSHQNRRKKKKSQCEDEDDRSSTATDDTLAEVGAYGDWATDGTPANQRMHAIFDTLTQHYGLSGAAAIAIVIQSLRETGGSFDPQTGENGSYFGDVNNPEPTVNQSGIMGIYAGGMNGGAGIWGFTPYENFSHSEWFNGSKAINTSEGWSVENETAYLIECEFSSEANYASWVKLGRTNYVPYTGTFNGAEYCDQRTETCDVPDVSQSIPTLRDFCTTDDAQTAITAFYYTNERGWRYDACIPGATLTFSGRPYTYPGILHYLPELTKLLNTPKVEADPSKFDSWMSGGGTEGGSGATVIDTSTSKDEEEDCIPEEVCSSASGNAIVDLARTRADKNIPYVLGGTDWDGNGKPHSVGGLALSGGMDCARLVYMTMTKLDFEDAMEGNLIVDTQYALHDKHGTLHPIDERQPGDQVFFKTDDGRWKHTGIFAGTNDSLGYETVIHEANVASGCVEDSFTALETGMNMHNEVGRLADLPGVKLNGKTVTDCGSGVLSDGPISAKQEDVIKKVKEFYRTWVNESGACVRFVCGAYDYAGLGYLTIGNGNGILCNDLYEKWNVSSNKGDLKPGMMVSYGNCNAGSLSRCGHVGIYVGNGKVVCNYSKKLGLDDGMNIDDWLAMNGPCEVGWAAAEGPLKATYGWCWYGGINLADGS